MRKYKILAVLLTIFLLLFTGCGLFETDKSEQSTAGKNTLGDNTSIINDAPLKEGMLRVYFLDVGQADSILIQLPSQQNLLIDAGNNADGPGIVEFIKNLGIIKIDYLVGTHPHEDHIGGLDNVIQAFEIGKFYMPKVTSTTKTFEDVLLAAKSKGLKITPAHAGMNLINQDDLKVCFLAPCASNYEDLNNWSVVTRVEYRDTSFLFTGDAEAQSEGEMLAAGNSKENLKADVLKVGHHGSHSSTTPYFLQVVDPEYAVISAGVDNDYGHPHKETLDKLNSAGIQVFRTDKDGTIAMTSDGKSITVEKLRSSIEPRAPDKEANTDEYIGNKNSKVFHRSSCTSLPAEHNRIYFKTREAAVRAGYNPCGQCKP